MEQDTNLSLDPHLGHAADDPAGAEIIRARSKQGIRTHVLLVVAMALVIAIVTGLCMLLIRHRLRDQVTADLSRTSATPL